MIGSYKNFSPAIADDAFVASTASVFGNVKIASRANIWFGAVIRADLNSIEIGKYVPSTLLALKIAAVFKTGVNDIFTLEDQDWN